MSKSIPNNSSANEAHPTQSRASKFSWATAGVFGVLALIWILTRLVVSLRWPLFLDDGVVAAYARSAGLDPSQRFAALADDRGLMGGWITGALVSFGFTPLGAIRAYHLIATFIAAVLTTYLAYAVWGRRASIATAVVVLTLPFLFVYSVVGIYDTFVMACTVAAILLQLIQAKRPRFDNAIVLGVIIGAAVLTKQSGAYLVALLPLSLMCFQWRPLDRRKLLVWFLCAGITYLVVLFFYSLQFLSPIFYDNVFVENHRTPSDALKDPFSYFLTNWPSYQAALIGYVTPLLIPVFFLGLWKAYRERPRESAFLTVWIVFPVAVAGLVGTIAAPRYLLITMPFVAVFIGVGLASIVNWAIEGQLLRRAAVAFVLAVCFVPAFVLDFRVMANPETASYPGIDEWHYVTAQQLSGGPFAEVVNDIQDRTGSREKVLVLTYNSFNAGQLLAALNRRDFGEAQRFQVSFTEADFDPTAKFVLVEDMYVPVYYRYGWPVDAVLSRDAGKARPTIDERYLAVQPILRNRGYKLVARYSRPKNGSSVLLYEKSATH